MLFESSILAAFTLPLLLWIVWITRRPTRLIARSCARLAAAALWISLIGLQVRCDRPPTIAVLIDVSPSTRGALLRDPKAVAARIAPLLAGRMANIRYFAAGLQGTDVEPNIDSTHLDVPPCDAAIILSDGRFDSPPSLPPIFPVIDPSLDAVVDGRITSIDPGTDVRVAVSVDGPARALNVSGAVPAVSTGLLGQRVVELKWRGRELRASLNAGDRWPENDVLSISAAAASTERWAVGGGVPGMRAVQAGELPVSLAPYLAASSIVLPSAAVVSDAQAEALKQFVESLGGTLIITGPPAAAPTALRDIAPLSATPPQPRGQWVVLLDASGSMAESGRWRAALAAAERTLATLGPTEVVSVVTFNRSTRVVLDHQSPSRAIAALHELAATSPSGPTGLRAALDTVVAAAGGPTRVLLVTDGDADLGDANPLLRIMSAAGTQLYAVLATQSAPIAQLAEQSGGGSTVEAAPDGWPRALERLAAGGVSSEHAVMSPVQGRGDLAPSFFHATRRWQSWPRQASSILAGMDDAPMIASWPVGLGRVISIAADIRPGEILVISSRLERSTNDPRFTADFDEAAGHVRLTATDAGQPMNRLAFTLQRDGKAASFDQISPGCYEAPLPPQADSSVGLILLDRSIIARREIAGRHAAEFNVIGNDRAALATLAARTGGRLIDVGDNRPIEIPKKYQWRSTRQPAAVGGVLLSLMALLLLRMPYWEERILRRLRPSAVKRSSPGEA